VGIGRFRNRPVAGPASVLIQVSPVQRPVRVMVSLNSWRGLMRLGPATDWGELGGNSRSRLIHGVGGLSQVRSAFADRWEFG
jgi:hypothetical protein